MNSRARPIRILLLETNGHLSSPVSKILQNRSALKLFDLTTVSTLGEAFREMDKDPAEIVLMEIDPEDDPEMISLIRLHASHPHAPVVALLVDRHQASALDVLHQGAHGYILESQIEETSLPIFLLRTIEQNSAQKAVRESEERFRMMIEQASDLILILDKAGVIGYAGPSTERIVAHRPSDLMTRNALDFIHRDDRRGFLDHFEKAFETGAALPAIQFRFRRPDGDWIHLEGRGRITPDPKGQSVCILNSHNVSHRVKLEEELKSLSFRDELTGLHNRRAFIIYLEQHLKLAQRASRKRIHLLFIDLDGFKGINDSLGHKEGDYALVESARLLKTTFRDADVVARLGGDEFVVLLTDGAQETNVEGLKERLSSGIDEWNRRESRNYKLSMSVGVVPHDPSERRSTEELLRQADELMYAHKKQKKQTALREVEPSLSAVAGIPPANSTQN